MSNLRINRLWMVQTGVYQEVMLRPYQARVERSAIMAVQEATQGGANITSGALAGIAGEIIRPTTEASNLVAIDHGWNSSRLRFLLEVEFPGHYGSSIVQYLSGYSDACDPTLTGRLDPTMLLYFNNSVQTQRMEDHTPHGLLYRQKVCDAAQILRGNYMPDYQNPYGQTVTMRPEDVFANVSASGLRGIGDTVIDGRTNFAMHSLKKSQRGNGAAPTFLANVMNFHSIAMREADQDSTLEKIMGNAAGKAKDPLVAQDRFLQELTLRTQLRANGCIAYKDLLTIDPTLDQRVVVSLNRGYMPIPAATRDNAEHFRGTTNETVMTTIIAHAVPAIMMDLMLTNVSFMANNRTMGGQHTVFLTSNPLSFAEGVDLDPYADLFLKRLTHEVLVDLSMNNAIDYDITCTVDVVGDTEIIISLEGRPAIRYVVPSFGDSLFSPIMAPNAMVLQNLAGEVTRVVDNMNVNYAPVDAIGMIPNQPSSFSQSVNHDQHSPRYLDVL